MDKGISKLRQYGIWMMAVVFLLAVSACGGGGGDDGASSLAGDAGDRSGTVSFRLMDAATAEYQAVYVTIDAVEVNVDDEWRVVANPEATYNLLTLVNGITEMLGDAELPAGEYSRLRMMVGQAPDATINLQGEAHPFANYVIHQDEEVHELKVPGGAASGITLYKSFSVSPEASTELVFDFDALASVVKAGKSGMWLLKPRIKALNTEELSMVGGNVFDDQGAAIQGAEVRAQAAGSTEDADAVIAATVTDETGGFQLRLAPGDYILTASFEGYAPASETVTVETGDDFHPVFYLENAESEAVDVTVVIENDAPDGDDADDVAEEAETAEDIYVSLRFLSADGDGEPIEIDSLNLGDGGFDSLDLPEGAYTVHATLLLGIFVMEADYTLEVVDGEPIILDILLDDFEPVADDAGPDDDVDEDGDEANNVTVCHKGHTITINEKALAAHLRHGDSEGACGGEAVDETGDEVDDIGDEVEEIEDEVEEAEEDLEDIVDDVEDELDDAADDVEDAEDAVEDLVG